MTADRGAAGFEESVLSSTGSEGLAADTGGFSVRNTNDFGGGAGRIADESRVFYLLGFNALEGKQPTAWRKLKVTAKRDDLEVRARKGYTLALAVPAPKKPSKRDEPREPDPTVMHAVDSPHDATALPLRARVYVLEPGKKETKVLVAAEFDTRALPESRRRPRRLEMSAVVRMRDAPLEFRYDQLVELGSEDEQAATPWRSVVRDFGLPPGVGSARVIVRDPETGALGSVSTRFEVPQPELLRLSTPILSSRVEPAEQKGARPLPAISVEREFPAGGGLYCQFEVVGARKGPDGKPKVTAGVSIWTSDGGRVRELPASPVAADANGRAVRLVGIDWPGCPKAPTTWCSRSRTSSPAPGCASASRSCSPPPPSRAAASATAECRAPQRPSSSTTIVSSGSRALGSRRRSSASFSAVNLTGWPVPKRRGLHRPWQRSERQHGVLPVEHVHEHAAALLSRDAPRPRRQRPAARAVDRLAVLRSHCPTSASRLACSGWIVPSGRGPTFSSRFAS